MFVGDNDVNSPNHETPSNSALIFAITLADSDSTRITRTPVLDSSTCFMAVAIATCKSGADRLNSKYATPSRMFNSISPCVASYNASANSGVNSVTPANTRVKFKTLMFRLLPLHEDIDPQTAESHPHAV